MKFLNIVIVSAVCFAWITQRANAERPARVEGEVLVGLTNGSDPNAFGIGKATGKHDKLKVARVKLKAGLSVEDALAALRGRADVEYAEPNYIR